MLMIVSINKKDAAAPFYSNHRRHKLAGALLESKTAIPHLRRGIPRH